MDTLMKALIGIWLNEYEGGEANIHYFNVYNYNIKVESSGYDITFFFNNVTIVADTETLIFTTSLIMNGLSSMPRPTRF